MTVLAAIVKVQDSRSVWWRPQKWVTSLTDVIFLDNPPFPSPVVAQGVTPQTISVSLDLPLRNEPVRVHQQNRTFLTLPEKLFSALPSCQRKCHHNAAFMALQTSVARGSGCQAFISVCSQNAVTSSHTWLRFTKLAELEVNKVQRVLFWGSLRQKWWGEIFPVLLLKAQRMLIETFLRSQQSIKEHQLETLDNIVWAGISNSGIEMWAAVEQPPPHWVTQMFGRNERHSAVTLLCSCRYFCPFLIPPWFLIHIPGHKSLKWRSCCEIPPPPSSRHKPAPPPDEITNPYS